MKNVAVIYRNRENAGAIEHLQQNLERVFEQYISVENFYLNELAQGLTLEADAYIVVHQDMLYPLKNHIENFSKVILMNRSINRTCVPAILELPKDTDVLVVNDSYESTIETTYAFYELGIGHINFIPYEKSLEDSGIYGHIQVAVTPNEEALVPSFIRRIINIGYREISFDTLLKLMHKLDLDLEVTNRNLIRHIHSVIEANTDFHSNYLDSYLKSQMLNRVIMDSAYAILVVNDRYQLVYSNDRANSIFGIIDDTPWNLSSLLDESAMSAISGEDSKDQLIRHQDENYLLDKSSIMLMDQVMGYCITLQNEKDLRNLENHLNSHLRKKGLYARYHFQDIIHHSAAMKECLATAKKAAVTDYTILIRGESGTGKELLAQSIHNYSQRKNAPFVAINCAALPESLLESELFGYEGGAFTGAQKNGKLGLFEQARSGTLFLDEVGDISPKIQSRLLRAIQEKQIMRIGSDKIIDVDVRIIAATNQNLEREVAAGSFRSDLFYRLNVIPVFIEPLRRRREDVLPLLSHFLGGCYRRVSPEERSMVLSYRWPGNVRELESAAIYYKTLAKFPDYLEAAPEQAPPDKAASDKTAASDVRFHKTPTLNEAASDVRFPKTPTLNEAASDVSSHKTPTLNEAASDVHFPKTPTLNEAASDVSSHKTPTLNEAASDVHFHKTPTLNEAASDVSSHKSPVLGKAAPDNAGTAGAGGWENQQKRQEFHREAMGWIPAAEQGEAATTTAFSPRRRISDRDRLMHEALSMIYRHSHTCHGIGRTALCAGLREKSIFIGDGKLRDFLSELEKQGLITIGKGRRGCQITLAGREFLDGSAASRMPSPLCPNA